MFEDSYVATNIMTMILSMELAMNHSFKNVIFETDEKMICNWVGKMVEN